MQFRYAVLLSLGTLDSGGDAFIPLTPSSKHDVLKTKSATLTTTVSMADDGFSDDFLRALKSGKNDNPDDNEKEEEEVASGSSRFRELLEASKKHAASEVARIPHAIENPFLNPPPPPAPFFQSINANPDDLSIEEQARMFREMMTQQQQIGDLSKPPLPHPLPIGAPQRVAKTDRAGRPVGRNRDADTIANTADLYFAQLKRDSTVRTIARIRGENDVAEQVFKDDGIKQLNDVLQKNPYLKGQIEKDLELIEGIPDEVLAPYFETSKPSEDDLAKSGPSYRQKLMERRKNQHSSIASSPHASTFLEPEPAPTFPVETPGDAVEKQSFEVPKKLEDPSTILSTPDSTPQSKDAVAQATGSNPPANAMRAPANPEETKQKIRTLMGLLLKHRGGPGFGKGRLKGPEIERFEVLLNEVSELLREESRNVQTIDRPVMHTAPPVVLDTVVKPPPNVPVISSSAIASPPNIDSTIACIDGAITMYKNSPPELRPNVVVTLRAALVSAVNTCNSILVTQPPPAISGNADGHIDNTLAVIEGALVMYKNSPPELKESVLVTLRAALISAAETCSTALVIENQTQVPSSHKPAAAGTSTEVHMPEVTTAVEHLSQVSSPFKVSPQPGEETTQTRKTTTASGTDPNSRKLQDIYETVKNAAGDGRLGIRSDLTAKEATELADQLVEIRSLLMEELEAGIPDPEPVLQPTVGNGSSTTSTYQQMLAKVRAEKATG